MRIFGNQGLLFLDGREVTISSGWLSLSEQLKLLRKHNEKLEKTDLTRLSSSVFENVRTSEIEQIGGDDARYPSFSLELFSPAATAVASWSPLINSSVAGEPGGALDLLPPIREWRADAQPACTLFIVDHAFFDVGGLTLEEIIEKIELDSPVMMAGHEIALAVYLQGIDLRGYLSHNDYRIVVPGVTMTRPDVLHPSIAWDSTHGLMNGLGVFAERPDRRLKKGTLLSIVTDRSALVRLS